MFGKFDSSNTVCCKNEWLLLSASFTTKSGKVFVLRLENVLLRGFILKPAERAQAFLKKFTRNFQNSPPFEISAYFFVTVSGNFECFSTLTLKQIFWKTKTLFKKWSIIFQLTTIRLKRYHFHTKLIYQKPVLKQIEW